MRKFSVDVLRRFRRFVDKKGPYPHRKACKIHPEIRGTRCWVWLGGILRGYGAFRLGNNNVGAHRVSYKIKHGVHSLDGLGPDGKTWKVLHKCDNGLCVRPSHLFKGTSKENMQDMFAKGRDKHGCPCGEQGRLAKLTNEQALRIRHLYATGNYTQKQLAKMFDVGKTSVGSIINRITWTHI